MRLAILGYGFISAVGNTEEELLAQLTAVQAPCEHTGSGIQFSVPKSLSATIEKAVEPLHDGNRLDRTVKLAAAATTSCLQSLSKSIEGRILVNIGSSRGATQTWENEFKAFQETGNCSTKSSPYTTPGNISSHIAKMLSGKTLVVDHSVTCGSGSQAVANAAAWILSGMADFAWVGGTEAPLTAFTQIQMSRLKITASPNEDSFPVKPLSAQKPATGMALGEGAAVFTLASEEKSPEAEFFISGIGMANEQSFSASGISEEGTALYESMQNALQHAKIKSPDAIITHAPGTRKGDNAEWKAIQQLFENPPRLFTNKHVCGHTLGASGVLSMVLACTLLKHGKIPELPYEAVGQNNTPSELKHIMVNATGFGGNAISIIITKR